MISQRLTKNLLLLTKGTEETAVYPRVLQAFLVIATSLYLLSVQLPTLTINIQLNNKLQSLSIEKMDADAFSVARDEFEARWNYWNAIRTVFAIVISLMLIMLLFLQ